MRTIVQPASETSSTRCTRGHQRGSEYGSDTTFQMRSSGASKPECRVTTGTQTMRRRSRTSSRCFRCDAIAAQVVERLDRLAPAVGIARLERRGEDLLEQRGLAVGGGPEDAQVAAADAELRELGRGLDDLPLGLVVERVAALALAVDDPVVLELLDELRRRAGVGQHLRERVERLGALAQDRHAPQRARVGDRLGAVHVGLRPAGGELLADHAQRQELVALEAQDRAQALDVVRASRAGSRRACGAARAASGPRGSGSSRSRCPGTRARATCRRPRSSATWPSAGGRWAPRRSSLEVRQLVLADLQLVTRLQLVRLDPVPVDVGAVQRAEVVEIEPVAAPARAGRGCARR